MFFPCSIENNIYSYVKKHIKEIENIYIEYSPPMTAALPLNDQ